jgi:hypothetical protein
MGIGHLIAMTVPCDLRFPELPIRFRPGRIAAPHMPMPETAIDHYSDPIFGKNNIRTSRQPLVMQTKTKPARIQPLPDHNLRPGVFATNGRHTMVALRLGKGVGHGDVFANLAKLL